MKLSRNGSPKDMDKLGKMRALFTVCCFYDEKKIWSFDCLALLGSWQFGFANRRLSCVSHHSSWYEGREVRDWSE